MALHFSPSLGGFYDDEIHAVLPGDAVEITSEFHAELLEAQSRGQLIVASDTGEPVAVDPPPATDDQLWDAVRARRLGLLSASDWTQMLDCPLSAEARAAWSICRQAWRDITLQPDPRNLTWADPPA